MARTAPRQTRERPWRRNREHDPLEPTTPFRTPAWRRFSTCRWSTIICSNSSWNVWRDASANCWLRRLSGMAAEDRSEAPRARGDGDRGTIVAFGLFCAPDAGLPSGRASLHRRAMNTFFASGAHADFYAPDGPYASRRMAL